MVRTVVLLMAVLGSVAFQGVQAQNTFVLKCKVFHIKTGLMPYYPVLINGQQTNTDGLGFINFALRNDRTNVTVELTNSAKFSLLYPLKGRLAVPKDKDEILEIIIGTLEDSQLLQKKYFSIIQKMIAESNQVITESNKQNFDSLAALIQKLEYRNNQLEKEKIVRDEKQKVYLAISHDLAEFTLRAANLSSALKHTSQYAFSNGLISNHLNVAVTDYNTIYNKLHPIRAIYERNVSEYWNSDSLGKEFINLMDFAFTTVHEQKILKLMGLIDQINRHRQKLINLEKITNGEKQKIQEAIEKELVTLDPLIAELLLRSKNFQNDFSL